MTGLTHPDRADASVGGSSPGGEALSATPWYRFRGWRVVLAGAIVQAIHGGLLLQAYGNYAVLLRREFGWSTTMLSAAFSLNRAESGLLGPIQGWALDRYGPTRVMQIGAVTMGAGFLLFSQIQNPVQFFAAFIVIAVGSSLSGFLSVTTAIVRWFERNRAKALSLGSIGFALGGLMTPGVVFVLERFGWRATAVATGLVVWAVLLPLTVIFDGGPADHGEQVDGQPPISDRDLPRAAGVSDRHLTAKEALRTRAFWMIGLGHASALLVVGAVIAHLSLYLTEEQGFTLQQASFLGAALPMVQLGGMLAGGVLGDRFDKRLIVCIAMAGHVVGLLLLTYATDRWMIYAFVPLHGIAWGVRGPLMQALRADYFGSTHFGQIMGYSSLVIMIGMVSGPLVAGTLRDVTGDYGLGFTILAIMALLGVGFFALATPPDPPPDRN